MLDALATLREWQVTVVLVTHRLAITAGIDKVLKLRDGRVEAFGPRDAVLYASARARVVSLPVAAAGSD